MFTRFVFVWLLASCLTWMSVGSTSLAQDLHEDDRLHPEHGHGAGALPVAMGARRLA